MMIAVSVATRAHKAQARKLQRKQALVRIARSDEANSVIAVTLLCGD